MKETYAHILIPHERSFILVFCQEQWLLGRPLVPEILGQTDCWSENADFQSVFARNASAVTPTEKS